MQACSRCRSGCEVMHADLSIDSLCSQAMVANNKLVEITLLHSPQGTVTSNNSRNCQSVHAQLLDTLSTNPEH